VPWIVKQSVSLSWLQGELRQIPAGKWFVLVLRFGRIGIVIEREREAKGLEERVASKIVRTDRIAALIVYSIAVLIYAGLFYWISRLLYGRSYQLLECLFAGTFAHILSMFGNWLGQKINSRRSPK
jgi:hypothetical protein